MKNYSDVNISRYLKCETLKWNNSSGCFKRRKRKVFRLRPTTLFSNLTILIQIFEWIRMEWNMIFMFVMKSTQIRQKIIFYILKKTGSFFLLWSLKNRSFRIYWYKGAVLITYKGDVSGAVFFKYLTLLFNERFHILKGMNYSYIVNFNEILSMRIR